jgi:hypothetical protein
VARHRWPGASCGTGCLNDAIHRHGDDPGVDDVRLFVAQGWLPSLAKYVVELIGALTLLVVVARGAGNGFRYVRAAYWLAFAALLLSMTCGILANHVEPGPLFAGIRTYLRAMPLFFLAAVAPFTEKQVKQQLWFLLFISLVQLPLAVYQRRATLAYGGITGDQTFGTLMDSGILSIFLIGGISVLMGLYVRKVISIKLAGFLFLLLVIPTTINETKGTLLLLPVAMGTAFILGAEPGARLKNAVAATAFLTVFAAIFIPIYDSLIVVRPNALTIKEFFMDPHHVESYFSNQSTETGGIPEGQQAGRGDAIVVPLRLISKDPVTTVFGLGPGNASHSSLGPQFTGKYNYRLEPYLITSLSVLEAELGLLGVFLLLSVYWLIFNDCRVVAASGSPLMSSLALAWAGMTVVMVASLPYKNLIPHASIGFLFWYFSGLIASERMRLSQQRGVKQRAAMPGVARERLHAT